MVVGERVVVTAVDEYGDPVEGTTVSLDGQATGTTAANGQAAVRIESGSDHELVASVDGRTSESVTVTAVVVSVPSPPTATPAATQTATETSETTPASGVSAPGFTPVAAVVALMVLAVLAGRRTRTR